MAIYPGTKAQYSVHKSKALGALEARRVEDVFSLSTMYLKRIPTGHTRGRLLLTGA